MTLRLHKPKEAGVVLGISENGVYRLVADGVLRAVDVARPGSIRSKTRIRSDDLMAYIEQQTRVTRS